MITITNLNIQPKYIFLKENAYVVTEVKDKTCIIEKCTIELKNNIIKEIYIDKESYHPNCDPKTGRFCISPIHGLLYDQRIIKQLLEQSLCCYNLNSCYNYDAFSKLGWR